VKIFLAVKTLTKLERSIAAGALTVFLTASFFWAGNYFYGSTEEVPATSASYSEGVIGQPVAINPVIASNNDADNDLIEILFSGLLDLASHYSASKDGTTWNVFLKDGLKWSDGKPLTSDDVVFTMETIQNFEARSPLFLAWQGVKAERISELEIEFSMRTPYAFFLDNLKGLKIIPKHIFGPIPAANMRLSAYNLEPVGSGPYAFAGYNKRKDGFITDYTLKTNGYYALEKPYIDTFYVRFFPGTAEIIKAFNTRKIDGFGDLNPQNLDDISASHQIVELNIPRYYAIFLNQNGHPALKDKAVRQALGFATDRNKIIETVFGNKAITADQPILPFIPGYATTTEPAEFSIEKAAGLLEKNGWKMNAATGIREKANTKGTDILTFDIIVPEIQFLTETADLIKATWAKAGIGLTPIVLNPSDISQEVIKMRNYQMILFGNILKKNPDAYSFWHSSERFYPGLNLSLYDSKKVDSLLEAVKVTMDEEGRNRHLAALQATIKDDVPAVFLFSPSYLYVTSPKFGGLDENVIASASDRFEHVRSWHLRTKRVFKKAGIVAEKHTKEHNE